MRITQQTRCFTTTYTGTTDHYQTKVSLKLAQHQARYKRYINRKVRSLPPFTIGHTVYTDRPPFTILSADRQTLLSIITWCLARQGLFKVLKVQDQFLTIDENSIANTISIDSATPIGFKHRSRLLKSKKHRHPATNLHKDLQDEFFVHKILRHHQMTNGLQKTFEDMPMNPKMATSNSIQYAISYYLTIIEPSEITSNLHFRVCPRLRHDTLISTFPENDKNEELGSGHRLYFTQWATFYQAGILKSGRSLQKKLMLPWQSLQFLVDEVVHSREWRPEDDKTIGILTRYHTTTSNDILIGTYE